MARRLPSGGCRDLNLARAPEGPRTRESSGPFDSRISHSCGLSAACCARRKSHSTDSSAGEASINLVERYLTCPGSTGRSARRLEVFRIRLEVLLIDQLLQQGVGPPPIVRHFGDRREHLIDLGPLHFRTSCLAWLDGVSVDRPTITSPRPAAADRRGVPRPGQPDRPASSSFVRLGPPLGLCQQPDCRPLRGPKGDDDFGLGIPERRASASSSSARPRSVYFCLRVNQSRSEWTR